MCTGYQAQSLLICAIHKNYIMGLRLWDIWCSCTYPYNTIRFMDVTEHARLNLLPTGLETAQSSRLNCVSNLKASWPKKISL